MADKDLRIKVTADTAAAQSAVRELAKETTGLAKASDDAGDAMKASAKATAEVAKAQQAAREAVSRASKALGEHNAIVQAFGKDSGEAAASLARLKAAEENAARATRDFNQTLEGAARQVAETAKSADAKAKPALDRMARSLQDAGKAAETTAGDLRTLEARTASAGKAAGVTGGAMATFKGTLAAMAVGALAGQIGDLGSHALSTAANFERMKTALATTLGGTEAADKAFAQIQAFAAATPYSLEEVTNGFLKLKARGLDASEPALRAYGDTASAMGKSLNDMVEAVADATTGEFERLKEFGIRASSQGDKVSLTFRGVTTTVAKEAKAIEAELVRLGQVNFAGGMDAQSKTLGGMWSTLKDGFDQFIVGVMSSGVTDALKSIMGTFAGMGETGALLSTILGGTLGTAFQVLSLAIGGAAYVLEVAAGAVNYLLSPLQALAGGLASVSDAAGDTAEEVAALQAVADEARRAENAEKARREAQRHYLDTVGKDVLALTAEEVAAYEAAGNAATEHGRTLGGLAEGGDLAKAVNYYRDLGVALWGVAEAHVGASKAADRQAEREAELWRKLEDQQRKAAEQAEEDAFFAANTMGPALPPGYEPPKEKRGGRRKEAEKARRVEIGAERTRGMVDPLSMSAVAYGIETKAREDAIRSMERELEILDARGGAETERIDQIFWTVEIESEAAKAREELIDAQISKEMELAAFQAEHAATEAERERARTRAAEVEHKRRLVTLRRAQEDEAKTLRKREQVVGVVSGAVTRLGEGMVDSLERAAEGEKGAVAAMVGELLKGVAKKHAILALGEAALAVGAAASYRYAAAAQHGAAAGLHTGVAVAAGVGAYAAGQVADARAGGGAGSVSRAPSGGGGGGSGGGADPGDDDLEAQEVPVSHEQLRRDRMPAPSASGGGITITINNPTIAGAGGVEAFAEVLLGKIEQAQRGGRRARF